MKEIKCKPQEVKFSYKTLIDSHKRVWTIQAFSQQINLVPERKFEHRSTYYNNILVARCGCIIKTATTFPELVNIVTNLPA